jgi:hypothetical protein
MALFSSLLSAVAGPLVTGFFGNKAESDAQAAANQANATKIQTAVADAKAAGINPYYAISGGAAATSATQIPRLASHTALGNAFDRVTDVLTGRQAQKDASDDVQSDLAEIARDTAARGTIAPTGAGAGVATGTAGPSAPSLISPRMQQNVPDPQVDLTAPGPFEDGPSALVTNPWHENSGMHVIPTMPDAEDVEARYGDLGSSIYGLGTVAADAGYSIGRAVGRWRENRYFRNLYQQRHEDDRAPTPESHSWEFPETYTYPRLGGMMGSSF